MAAYGYNCGGDANGMAGEWELCSKKEFKTHPMAENLYKLVTGKSPSSDEYGYKLPYGLPDGNYQVVEDNSNCDKCQNLGKLLMSVESKDDCKKECKKKQKTKEYKLDPKLDNKQCKKLCAKSKAKKPEKEIKKFCKEYNYCE